jgi:hypothetical protein
MLELGDAGGARRPMVGVDAPGGRPIRLSGANGVGAGQSVPPPRRYSALNLDHPDGQARAALAIRGTGEAGFALFAKDGPVVRSAP